MRHSNVPKRIRVDVLTRHGEEVVRAAEAAADDDLAESTIYGVLAILLLFMSVLVELCPNLAWTEDFFGEVEDLVTEVPCIASMRDTKCVCLW